MKRARVNPISVKKREDNAEFAQAKIEVHARSAGVCETWFYIGKWLETGTEPVKSDLPDAAKCGLRAAHVHHRKFRSRGGSNALSNLLDLCNYCHGWIHAHPEASNILGLSLHAEQSEAL